MHIKSFLIIVNMLFLLSVSLPLQAQTRRALVIGIGQQEDKAWGKINGDKDVVYVEAMLKATRKEGQLDEDKNDFRLVFEIDFVGQMFDEYMPIKLDIWRTFTDTTIERIVEQNNNDEGKYRI